MYPYNRPQKSTMNNPMQFARKHLRFLRPFYAILRNWRIRLLKWRPTYDSFGLITDHLCEFTEDERFKRSYDVAIKGRHAEGLHTPSFWTNHVTCWAAEQGTLLEGDFVECGVLRGFTSRMVMEYVGFEKLNKKFYLIDTYKGLDDRYLLSSERGREFGYSDIYSYVKEAFSKLKNAVVVRGVVPEILSSLTHIEKVAYLALDMNSAIPEIAAAEFFWPKMSHGSVMVLDDYGHQGFDEQRLAFDKFAKEKKVPILCLPTGQALIIKS